MIRTSLLTFAALSATCGGTVAGQEDATPAARRYQELIEQYEKEGGARGMAPSFLELADGHPEDPAAVDALLWVVANVRGRADTTKALETLADKHVESPRLAAAAADIVGSRSPSAEKLLRAVMDKNPDPKVRAHAAYQLAKLLEAEAQVIAQLRSSPDLAPRILQYYGSQYGKHLASLTPEQNETQREKLYETIRDRLGDQQVQGVSLGDFAAKALFAIRNLSVGKTVPEIVGQDVSGESFKLSDYRGKIVMLSFWGHW